MKTEASVDEELVNVWRPVQALAVARFRSAVKVEPSVATLPSESVEFGEVAPIVAADSRLVEMVEVETSLPFALVAKSAPGKPEKKTLVEVASK